jgi:hypothetical protein
VPSVEQYLAAATMNLPEPVATSMREALARGNHRITAGRYSDGDAVCPLGAADDIAGSSLQGSVPGSHYGGCLLRFAVAFDFCAEEMGLDAAVEVVRGALVEHS